jgi:hypothetical protein
MKMSALRNSVKSLPKGFKYIKPKFPVKYLRFQKDENKTSPAPKPPSTDDPGPIVSGTGAAMVNPRIAKFFGVNPSGGR